MGFLCGSAGKQICLQCGRLGFDPWVGKIPWRRERLPTPGFWPGELHGLYSPWCRSRTQLSNLNFRFHSNKINSNFFKTMGNVIHKSDPCSSLHVNPLYNPFLSMLCNEKNDKSRMSGQLYCFSFYDFFTGTQR